MSSPVTVRGVQRVCDHYQKSWPKFLVMTKIFQNSSVHRQSYPGFLLGDLTTHHNHNPVDFVDPRIRTATPWCQFWSKRKWPKLWPKFYRSWFSEWRFFWGNRFSKPCSNVMIHEPFRFFGVFYGVYFEYFFSREQTHFWPKILSLTKIIGW